MKKESIETIYRRAITLKPAIRLQSLSLSADVGMNYALSSDFCVEDKGCRGQGISAKIPCQSYTKYHGSKLPIFITPGAYK